MNEVIFPDPRAVEGQHVEREGKGKSSTGPDDFERARWSQLQHC
jgi:hypothetical protein